MENLKQLNNEEIQELSKKLWESERMQKFIVDTYDFYKTKDNLIIELEKVNKITIDKTMYYDDEYAAPEKTLNNFINYNSSNMPGRNIDAYLEEKEKLQSQGCASGRYDYNGIYFIECYSNRKDMVSCSWFDDDMSKRYFKRYLTKEEEKDYIELMNERKEQYIERLKKYFKRYGKHITTYGYWANR